MPCTAGNGCELGTLDQIIPYNYIIYYIHTYIFLRTCNRAILSRNVIHWFESTEPPEPSATASASTLVSRSATSWFGFRVLWRSVMLTDEKRQ